jgi:hypothetical protein
MAPALADSYNGAWSLQPANQVGAVSLRLEYRRQQPGDDETWSSTDDVPLSEIAGVSDADFRSNGEHKTFVIRRDAGDFRADGWFAHGIGSGSWTFAPSSAFRDALAHRGISNISESDQFHLAMLRFKLSTLNTLLGSGFERPSASELARMAEHGVDAQYIAALRDVPLQPKTADTLIRLRDHGVSTAYVQGLQRLGYTPSVQDLVRLVDHGVSISFIERMRSHGYTHLSAEDLIRLRDHGF